MRPVDQAAAAAKAWLCDAALPLWGSAGVDETGAFHERLDFDGQPDLTAPRRMRVQARQLYVFSEAALRGWWEPARRVADRGFEALVRDCWARDGRPGFLHTFTPDKTPLDCKRDAYDHAFGLFALAWYYKAAGDARALVLAHQTLDVMESRLADRRHGGFKESAPPVLPRRSDPHMHLLEAMLEWTEATGEDRFRVLAGELIALFKDRFFDRATGTLTEYFTDALDPAEDAAGQIVAPGHHFEWTWLLQWARRLGVGEAAVEAQALYDFAIRHGLDACGAAIDECDRQGRQVRPSRRAWPQTELIKARLAAGAEDAAAEATFSLLNSHLATRTAGLWMDQFDAEGRGITDRVPASTLYHVVVAFRELLRIANVQPGDP